MLGEFCHAGGFTKFAKTDKFKKYYGVDHWPIFLMMSAREGQPSLSGQFWYSVVDGIKDGLAKDSKLTLKELFTKAEESYWIENAEVQMMNEMMEGYECKFGELSETFGMLSQVEETPITSIFSQKKSDGLSSCPPCKTPSLQAGYPDQKVGA